MVVGSTKKDAGCPRSVRPSTADARQSVAIADAFSVPFFPFHNTLNITDGYKPSILSEANMFQRDRLFIKIKHKQERAGGGWATT